MPPRVPAIISGTDYLNLPQDSAIWLVDSLVPAGGSVLLYGTEKLGKSFLSISLALAISDSTQTNWLGFPVRAHGRVVYIQLDTPRSLWRERLTRLHAQKAAIHTLDLADRETLALFPFNILNNNHHDYLQQQLAEIKPVCVIIDTLREVHRANADKDTEMQQAISQLVSATMPAALILVSHARKRGDTPEAATDEHRGSNYVVCRMDTILRLTRKKLYHTGRAIEDGSVRIQRLPSGLWERVIDIEEAIPPELAEASVYAQAQQVSHELGITPEAARSRIRRKT